MNAAPQRRSWSELLGSMRFAISSLSILSVASIIGTLLKQREPMPNYVNQFGPFWAELFDRAGLYEVYNAWWFIVVLAFLVASTSLCLLRNTPKMLSDMTAWREKLRASGLRAFRHRGAVALPGDPVQAGARVVSVLQKEGYRVKADPRSDGLMLAARKGASNRLGYVFAHAGIVIVCLGGLLDSEMPLRIVSAWGDKQALPPVGTITDPPAASRLSVSNPSWRGNIFLAEGSAAEAAILSVRDGVLIQDLPFRVELKEFRVEYYSTGMPRLFASEVEIVDLDTGARRSASIKVNEPLHHRGVTLYQSSFDDGGSKLKLRAVFMDGSAPPVALDAQAGTSVPLDGRLTQAGRAIEISGFKAINVENLNQPDEMGADVARPFQESVAAVLSPSAGKDDKALRNVGASVQYKLRDAAGQAREFNVYMNPVPLDGASVYLAGVRENPNEGFRYLRIPADEKGGLDDFLRLRAALGDTALRTEAVARYVRRASVVSPDSAASNAQLAAAAQRGLDLFAEGGLQSIATFLKASVPEADQSRVADALLKVLGGSLWELWQLSRERAGLPASPANEESGRFLQVAQNALSDTFLFGAPVLFTLDDFSEVKASVLQASRAPGKNVVYLGSLLLTLGVFAMFYVRERRVWCWLSPAGSGMSDASFAMSSARQSLDLDRDFDRLQAALAAHSVSARVAPELTEAAT